MTLQRAYDILTTKTFNDCPGDYLIAFYIARDTIGSMIRIKNKVGEIDKGNGVVSGEKSLNLLADIYTEADRYE